jgi:excinuclease ABC subunit C
MISKLSEFEYIVVDSDPEALILENTLIKKFKPPFNARLKDDKTYPYIKIDRTEEYPQVYVTRKVIDDGAKYFGPFANAGSIRKTLTLLKKLFPYRSCTKRITGIDKRACLEFYINRCAAPCIGVINYEGYREIIDQVILFLEGKTESVLLDLRSKMVQASNSLEFEQAASLRDQIEALESIAKQQQIKTDSVTNRDQDIIGMYAHNDQACIELFYVRNGKLTGRDDFLMDGALETSPDRIMSGFVKQFYQSASYIPSQIIVHHLLEDTDEIVSWLRSRKQGRVTLIHPKRGPNKRLVEMAAKNAEHHLRQLNIKSWDNTQIIDTALQELQEELNLPRLPKTIECYDISNLQGTNPVGSMVVFEDGLPKPSEYRHFRVKSVKVIDDYSMMQEIILRRCKRLPIRLAQSHIHATYRQHPQSSVANIPDLMIIDGGKGHLSAALEVLLTSGVDYIPLASLSKKNEWLHRPQTAEPIILNRRSAALQLVQRLRDEAHRFAINYHRKLRSKSQTLSHIDRISGIGPKRRRLLLTKFGSITKLRKAAITDIAAIPGISRNIAIRIKQTL